MFTAIPVPTFAAKLSIGRECGLLFLSPANSNSAGNQFTRRPGNESEEALSNGLDGLQGAGQFEPIGQAAMRVLKSVKKKAGEQSAEGKQRLPLASNEALQVQGGLPARRSSS